MSFYYAVKRGRKSGIYGTWSECSRQVYKYPGARYKKFSSKSEAESFVCGEPSSSKANLHQMPTAGTSSSSPRYHQYYSKAPKRHQVHSGWSPSSNLVYPHVPFQQSSAYYSTGYGTPESTCSRHSSTNAVVTGDKQVRLQICYGIFGLDLKIISINCADC
jgi:hypothetical protein